MKIEIPKEWVLKMAHLEGDAEIGVGMNSIDPTFDGDSVPTETNQEEFTIALGRFVSLMRRDRGITLEKLAEDIDVEVCELIILEEDTRYKPEPRTVYQLANYFNVSRNNLLQVAGLTAPRDSHLVEQAVRFAARSESVVSLTPQERSALEAFVAVLSEKK